MGKPVGGFDLEHFGSGAMNYHPNDNVGMHPHFNGGEVPIPAGAQRMGDGGIPHMGTSAPVTIESEGMGIDGKRSSLEYTYANPALAPRQIGRAGNSPVMENSSQARDRAAREQMRAGKRGEISATLPAYSENLTTKSGAEIPYGMSTESHAAKMKTPGLAEGVAAYGSTDDIRDYESQTGNTLAVSPELRNAVDANKDYRNTAKQNLEREYRKMAPSGTGR